MPLGEICSNCTEVVFFIHPQVLDGARKNVFRYDGSASGRMLYNWHRDYNPGLGRYVQSDPIGLGGGINGYAYAGGRPVMLTDTTGKCPWCIAGAIIGAGINLGVQLSQNGGNLGDVNWLHVGVAAAGGALGGGFGSAIYDLSSNLLFNIAANAAVGSAIGAASTAYQNCVGGDHDSVLKSAELGLITGGLGGWLGAGSANAAIKAGAAAQNAFNQFVYQLMGESQAFANSTATSVQNGIAGAGAFLGNAASNVVGNTSPLVLGP